MRIHGCLCFLLLCINKAEAEISVDPCFLSDDFISVVLV